MAENQKNVHEILALLKAAGVQAKEVMADGKANIFDLPKLVALWEPAKAAIEGAQEVTAELNFKTMTADQVEKLVTAVMDVGMTWMSVFTPKA